ncbi:MAG: AAA family ATPase [Bacilli bacterium]|nr:AAA family ATPase [Bacilli bacterium]
MRVSFLGKGGSGKTTISSAFIGYLLNKKEKVLAIDADMNVHLEKTFHMETKPLSDASEEIKEYLEGNRRAYTKNNNKVKSYLNKVINGDTKAPIIGCTPPARSSKFIRIDENDPFIKKYATKKDGLYLMTVGTYNESEIGSSCYHGKLEVAEMVYHHLLDNENNYVVSDSTAGIDSVGTSMFFVSDINIFVIEPTKKGIDVYKDFKEVSKKYGINTYVIGNKIENQEDIDFLKQEIGTDVILGFIKNSSKMRKFEQGNAVGMKEFIKENTDTFDRVCALMQETKRDWDKYYQILLEVYKANIEEWYNAFYGEKLEKYIDEDFHYEKVFNEEN